MKILSLFILLLTSSFVQSQNTIIDFPDVEASFPGGATTMAKWINTYVEYPRKSLERGEQGKVYLSFVVEPDGSISNIVVEKGATKLLNQEAVRVVAGMPKWIAGEVRGRKCRTRCRLPIVFTIKGSNKKKKKRPW